MPNITIQPLTIADADELLFISKTTFITAFGHQNNAADMEQYITEAFTQQKMLAELDNRCSAFFFALVNNQTAGYLKLNWDDAQSDGQLGKQGLEIERIYVLAEFQGQHIGKLLVDHAVNFCRQQNKAFVWLGVWTKNQKAIQFYQKNGFNIVGSHPFLLGQDPQTDYLMQKML
jgi:diamine N-acetyltransferase